MTAYGMQRFRKDEGRGAFLTSTYNEIDRPDKNKT